MPSRDDETPLIPPGGTDPLARALAKLEPQPAGLNREALLFAAGRAATNDSLRFWKRLCLVQAMLVGGSLTLGVVYWDRPTTAPTLPADSANRSGTSPNSSGGSEPSDEELAKYLRLHAVFFQKGLPALESTEPVLPTTVPNYQLPAEPLAVPYRGLLPGNR
ncbi:MAG: hypothetical protein ACRCZF_16170 [Gemmataceae bacterium]